MPRGYKGTKKPKGWKVGQRIEIIPIATLDGVLIADKLTLEENPVEEYQLPVKATVVEPVLVFHSLCIGWAICARIDNSSRDGIFGLEGIIKI